jgi:hypothetical protein
VVSDGSEQGRAAGSSTPDAPTSYLNAALRILADQRSPLTAREIAAEAIRRGLLRPAGQTPEASMSARLYIYVRDHPDGPLVRVHEPGPARARRGSVRWALRVAAPS